MRRQFLICLLLLLFALPVGAVGPFTLQDAATSTGAGTTIYQGGNVTEIINPSSSGTHTLQTGGANLEFDLQGGTLSLKTGQFQSRLKLVTVTLGAMTLLQTECCQCSL